MPRCVDASCARWRPDLSALSWAGGIVGWCRAIRFNSAWYCSRTCVEQAALRGLAQSAAISLAVTPRRSDEVFVSYLSSFDVRRVRPAPIALPKTIVRVLGLVPFETDEK